MDTYKTKRLLAICMALLIGVIFLAPARAKAAEAPVNLGTTASFAVLAGETVTNTGPTTIGGDAGGNVGVYPGTAVTGFPPGTNTGWQIHADDDVAEDAKADLNIAYGDAASRSVTDNMTGQDLGGKTLTSGVYKFDSEAGLTGTLTLDSEILP